MKRPPIASGDSKAMLDLLWARVRQRGDLPGFSKVVSAIVGAMRGDDEREFNMTKTVLSDPALTQKVLRLANSAMYSVFGRNINTVSKAVIVLGTESIGHLALGLKLLDGLNDVSSESAGARSEMEKAVLAGHIARQVASTANTRDTEEAVVCSMLHTLGRMMVSFYLPEIWLAASARIKAGQDEDDAARAVFGLALDEIGMQIAQQWSLPASLVNSLQDVHPKTVTEPLSHADWLAAISTMSVRCADVLHGNPDGSGAAIAGLADGYSEMLGLDVSQVVAAVRAAQVAVAEDAAETSPEHAQEIRTNAAPAPVQGKPANAAQILAHGVADMGDAAKNGSSTGQLLTMALETIYKGLGLSRAVVFLHHYESKRYIARMCFGDGVQEIMAHLAFDDAYQPDVFHAALANDKMIFVENARAANFVNKLPRWWKQALPSSRSFMVLPLTVNRHPAGFIYGDWDDSLPPTRIDAIEIPPLDELRALVTDAVELRRRVDGNSSRSSL